MGFLILSFSLSGCTQLITPIESEIDQPEMTGTITLQIPPTETEPKKEQFKDSAQPVLFGLWVKDLGDQRDLIVFSNDSVYLVEVEGSGEAVFTRESFFAVQSINWVRGELELKLSWVRINGKQGGVDSPLKSMKIYIDETSMYYGMGDEDAGMPTETPNGPWMKK